MKPNIRLYRCLLISNDKILNGRGEEEKVKDQVFMRRGYEENLTFFHTLNVRGGEELQLQKYVEDIGWVTKNKKTLGRGVQEINA